MHISSLTEDLDKLVSDLREWLVSVSGADWKMVAKLLSGNDTLANAAHQAGPYISKSIIFNLFPSILSAKVKNPRKAFSAIIDSHGVRTTPTAIWYNGLTRNEARITGWGGSQSPLLDPEATGSLVAFAFRAEPNGDAEECRIWLCSTPEEEEVLLDRVGPVESRQIAFLRSPSVPEPPPRDRPCALAPEELDPDWRYKFPTTADVVALTIARLPSATSKRPDERLLARRECEYELFRSIEEASVLPRIKEGFGSVDIFVDYANSVTNRRKARSGASLGLQTSVVFAEEKLSFTYDAISEGRKRPDFLFPSAEAYQASKDSTGIRMLAAKTTCKDRWRQILNEADKIPRKYLLTLQPGLSTNQFQEMKAAGVTLIVPKPLHQSYPRPIRSELVDLVTFIAETKAECGDAS